MLTKDQKPDSADTLNPSEADYQQKFDREFGDIEKNYSDETEHPLGDKESGATKQDTLADKENSAESSKPAAEASSTPENSFYNAAANKGAFAKLRGINIFEDKKKTGGILGAFLAIVAAVIMGISTLGPLQFIHFAQMLHSFHLSDQEYNGNSRLRKLIIYAQNNGDTSKTRLGVLEGKYSNKIDAKLAKNGWAVQFTKSGAVFNGFTYDPSGDGKISAEEMKSKLEADGVKGVTIDDGKVKVPPDSMKYWSNKALIKQIYSGSNRDIGRITGAFEKRILIKRSGITLNPITKLDQKINKKIGDFISEERAKRLTGKAPPVDFVTKASVDPNNPDATNKDIANEAQKGIDDAKSGKIKTTADLGIKTAAGLGIVCAVKAISSGVSDAKRLNATIPLVQASAEVLAVGSKTQDGNDVSMRVMNEYSKSLYGRTEENKSSWSESSTLQYEQTGKLQGERLPDEFNPSGQSNALADFFNKVPGLDGVCSALAGPFGIIIDFASGPVSGAISIAVNQAIQASGIFNTLIAKLSGEIPNLADPKYAGAVYGEAANVGTRILANETSSTMGGRVLNDEEELALNTVVNNEKIAEYKKKPLVEKYLDPYQYDTPVAKAIDSIDPNSAPKTIANLPKTVFANITAPFSKKVSAADEESKPSEVYYGNKKVGFAAGSLDAPELEDPYENAEKAFEVLKSDNKYVEMLKICNRIDVVGLPDGPLDFKTEQGTSEAPVLVDQTDLPPYCFADNTDDYPYAMVVRTAAFDTMKMKGLACIEFDDTESCDAIGLSDGALSASSNLKVMSFNMLAQRLDDKYAGGDWETRKVAIKTVVSERSIDILGAQEIFNEDMHDDLRLLFPEYGITKNDPGARRNPILYKNSVYQLEKEGVKDLTSTRYMVWAVLKNKTTGARLLYVNTHFEVHNKELAATQAQILIDEVKKINTENLMVIVTGDFNSEIDDGAPQNFLKAGYTNTKEAASTKINAEYATFNGYNLPMKKNNYHIDYIFIKENSVSVAVNSFEVVIDTPGGVIPSDHNAIVAGLSIAGSDGGVGTVPGGNPSLYCTDAELASKEIYWPVKDPAPINSHDLPKPKGTPVYAITSGVVTTSEDLLCTPTDCDKNGYRSYGRVIKIDHGIKDGKVTYAHLDERLVNKGDRVAAGQLIGLVGNNGNTSGGINSGYHLHVDFNSGTETTIPWLRRNSPLEPKGDICTP